MFFSIWLSQNSFSFGHIIWPKIASLGRKAMINLDSMLKSRDVTLLTKVHPIKSMVLPIVMYGCESWTMKKLSVKELLLLNCGIGEDSCESLGLQGDPTS